MRTAFIAALLSDRAAVATAVISLGWPDGTPGGGSPPSLLQEGSPRDPLVRARRREPRRRVLRAARGARPWRRTAWRPTPRRPRWGRRIRGVVAVCGGTCRGSA